MKRRLRTLMATGAVTMALLSGSVVAATVADAATGPICEQYGSTHQGNYVVMNNKWNSAAGGQQCIDVTNNGFRITSQPNSVPTNGGPASYPAIFSGCHYTNCSSDGHFPKQVSSIRSINSSVSWNFASGVYNASYDIWLDPSPKRDGVNQTEIMIWFARQGPIQPIGQRTATANLGGRTWEVWTGSNGTNNVVSYAVSPGGSVPSASFNTLDFILDAFKQGSRFGNTSWYLTSIQAGFEPWSGGVGLAVTSFNVAVNGGTPPTTPPGTPPPNNGGCTATYRTIDSWSGGSQGEITVKNNGSSTLNGWTANWAAGGQTITQSWNASLSSSGSSYTAKPLDWNAKIGPGASTSFGFIASGNVGSISPTCSAS